MNKIKPIINIILILFLFIALHNAIVVGIGNVTSFFREDNRDSLEIETLKLENENLQKSISDYERSLENLSIYDGKNRVLGRIAIRDIYDFYNFLTISTDTKVKNGDAVLNEDGLIGIITEANTKTAKVNLITGNSKISVKIGDDYGILDCYDKENNLLIVHNIDHYKTIEEGEEVTTSGLQEIPKNIKIGVVSKTEIKGVEKIVYVSPYVDFDNLNYLVVLAK